jgi:mono/diheme cytochrome c family protein
MRSFFAASVGVALAALATACGGGDETAAGTEALTGDPDRGKAVFLEHGCQNCHTFKAAPGVRERHIGPDLDQVVGRYGADFIRTSIVDPRAYIEKGESGSIGGNRSYGTPMPTFGPTVDPPHYMSPQELEDLVSFLTERAAP